MPEVPVGIEEHKEREPNYDHAVLGHPPHETDLDQAVALFLARKVGLIPADSPVVFAPRVEEAELSNKKALVVEGFDPKREGTNTLETGNFHNGAKDVPAAYMILRALIKAPADDYDTNFRNLNKQIKSILGRRGLNGREQDMVLQLANHLREAEQNKSSNGDGYPNNVLNNQDLASIKDIFHAVRQALVSTEAPSNPDDIAAGLQSIFDTLCDSTRTQPLTEVYAAQLAEYAKLQQADAEKLHRHFYLEGDEGPVGLRPNVLKSVVLPNQLRITYADVRGTGVRFGGPTEAMEAIRRFPPPSAEADARTETDILLFVNDELDEKGTPTGKNKLMIKVPKRASGQHMIDFGELARRLNISEAMFGGGDSLVQIATFGGHEEAVLSPQFTGSALDPATVYVGLQESLQQPVQNEVAARERFHQFAGKLGVDHFTIRSEKPRHPYELEHWVVEITLPGQQPVSITERDLAVYEAVLTDSVAENVRIVGQKTEMSEAAEVVAKRRERALADFPKALAEQNAPRLLEALDNMDLADLDALASEKTGERLLELYEAIAADPAAISMVYDKFDTRFRLHHNENLNEWAKQSEENYREAIHYYRTSLQRKVDLIVNAAVLRRVATSKNPSFQGRYGQALKNVFLSREYQESHTEVAYDSHLNNMLAFLTNDGINSDIRRSLLRGLVTNFTPEMRGQWQEVVRSATGRGRFQQLIDLFPEEISNLVDVLDFTVPRHEIPGIRGSVMNEPQAEAVRAFIERKKSEGEQPVLNLVVRVGKRDIDTLLEERGIWTNEEDEWAHKAPGRDDILAQAIVPRWLAQAGPSRSLEAAEELPTVGAIFNMIKQLEAMDTSAEGEKAPIRIVCDGFPQSLGFTLYDALRPLDPKEKAAGKRPDIGEDVRDRLRFCIYMQGENAFVDIPYRNPHLLRHLAAGTPE